MNGGKQTAEDAFGDEDAQIAQVAGFGKIHLQPLRVFTQRDIKKFGSGLTVSGQQGQRCPEVWAAIRRNTQGTVCREMQLEAHGQSDVLLV